MKECIKIRFDREIVVSENRSSFKLENPQKAEIEQWHVDGCCITQGRRCDWRFLIRSKNEDYFVELKGSDLASAIEQLESSIRQLRTPLAKSNNMNLFAVIVSSRVPAAADTSLQIARYRFLKDLSAKVIVKSGQLCINLDR